MSESWRDRALCAQVGGEIFFVNKGESTKPAKLICKGCEVAKECLQWALDNDEHWGVYGGFSERERHRLKRGQPAVRPVRNGFGHGYACKCVMCRRVAA